MFISWALNIIMQAASRLAGCSLHHGAGKKIGCRSTEELGEFPKYLAPELIARKTRKFRFYQPGPETEPELLHLLPFSRANFTWVRSYVLCCFDLRSRSDASRPMPSAVTSIAWRYPAGQQRRSHGQPDLHLHAVVEVTGQGASRVADHRIFDLAMVSELLCHALWVK